MNDKKEPEIIAEVGGLVDETGVCLAIYGDDLEPEELTEILGCPPTHAHRRGDRHSGNSPPFRTGAWLLQLCGTAPTGPEELLRGLLARIPGDPNVWEALAGRYSIQLRFGIHFTGWNKGFDLPADLVAEAARLKAGMGFDLYGYGDDDA